jgi:DNA repair protein RadA/Sms
MVEELIEPRAAGAAERLLAVHPPRRLSEIEGDAERRIRLPMEEFSRVLGGGIVPGSVVLIGGDPGIGKSTLLLQMALSVAQAGKVLYVSGEESAPQIKARALRLLEPETGDGQKAQDQVAADQLYLLTETDVERIVAQVEALTPALMVVDSIQAMQLADIGSAAGSISQVRESAARLQALAKTNGVAVFLVGHVTKEGAIAGPRVLEHLVDTVLYLEGDAFHAYRLLRSVKNRFGPTTEVGVFEMRGSGLSEVPNPSQAFLAERMAEAPGSAIALTMEGTRPLLVEVQGLTSPSPYGNPRRTANGVDFNRLLLTVAVLSRRAGLPLGEQDVFVNVVGGLQVREPGIDLALAAAIASSARDRALPPDLAMVGEVGLSGELRAVPQLGARLSEAAKLGFRRAVVPAGGRRGASLPKSLEVLAARSLPEALRLAMG